MLEGATWRKSSPSDSQGAECVEVAITETAVGVRDSKDRTGGTLVFTPGEWDAFISLVKTGLDR